MQEGVGCGEVQEGVGCGEVQGCWVWGGAGVLGVGRCRGVGCGEVQGCWVWGGAGVLGVGKCRGCWCREVLVVYDCEWRLVVKPQSGCGPP